MGVLETTSPARASLMASSSSFFSDGDGDGAEKTKTGANANANHDNGDLEQSEQLSVGICTSSSSCFFQRRHYLCPSLQSYCVGSVYLAFLSHGCFVIAALFYIELAYVQLAWLRYALLDNDVPSHMINEDDDSVWRAWASVYQGQYRGQSSTFQDVRAKYYDDYAFYIWWGASFFVLVGVWDYLRYWDAVNAYMILAGLAGVLSGSTDSGSMAIIWECVSVHLYLLESFTLISRDHNHGNVHANKLGGCGIDDYAGGADHDDKDDYLVAPGWQSIFRMGDVLFLIGSILDVVGSYLDVAGAVGMWVAYTDMVACYLWLGCALMNWVAEIYFLRKQFLMSLGPSSTSVSSSNNEDNDNAWEILCY